MSRAGRIAAVTAGLVGTGAVLGTLSGACALMFVMLVAKPRLLGLDELGFSLLVGGIVGAPIGAITAPLLGWLLLRQVPLGRMFAGCAFGTILGGAIGWITSTGGGDIAVRALGSAFAGCLLAAVMLRLRAQRRLGA